MGKMTTILASALMSGLLGAPPQPPALPREFRGLWVATVANIDFPTRPGLDAESMDQELVQLVARARQAGINALLYQARPTGDAAYASSLEPWSEYLGPRRPTGWDPLARLISLAHGAGIEVHAWINPFRARHSTLKNPLGPTHLGVVHPDTMVEYGNQLWFNPADSRVQARALTVARDFLRRYPLDGLHMDDYFYPYPLVSGGKRIPFDDGATYQAYRQRGGPLDLAAWRRHRINQFVQNLGQVVRKERPSARYGISPFGIYRPGIPRGIEAGLDPYVDLSADALLWLKRGWIDYLAPQLYWPLESKGQPFEPLLRWWKSQTPDVVHLWPGMSISRLDPDQQNWPISEIENQVNLVRKYETAGMIFFSAKMILNNTKNIRQELFPQLMKEAALPPALLRGSKTPPRPPRLAWKSGRLTWTLADIKKTKWVTLQSFEKGQWKLQKVLPPRAAGFENMTGDWIAVRTVNLQGQESPPVLLRPAKGAIRPGN